MRTFLLTLLVISLSNYSKAECYYSAYELKFEIETNDKTINCYARMSACDFDPDSLHNQDYLLAVLYESAPQSNFSLFESRISYSYCIESEISCLEKQKDTIFQLLNKTTLSKPEIKSITVVECKRTSAMIHISRALDISDADWFSQKPIEAINFGFGVCSNQIFIHGRNETVDKILSKIKALKLKINELNEIELSPDEERKYYSQMESLINLIGSQEKVIVITECTD